jgi:hypothetical protein
VKASFFVVVLLATSSASSAWSSQQPNSQTIVSDGSQSQRQIVDLPLLRRGFKPKLTLQHALKIAEHFVEKEHIDLSSYFLLEARFISYGDKVKEPRWHFMWLSSDPVHAKRGVDFQLTVNMDEKVSIIPSM